MVSAKSGHNINDLFQQLAEEIYLIRKNNNSLMVGGRRNPRLRVEDSMEKKKKK